MALAPHDVQAAAEAPPVAAKYLPAAQSVQTALPCSANLPAGHETQVSVVDVAVKYLPATQGVQVSEAASPMGGPQYPALQVQDVLALLADKDAALAPQCRQAVDAVLAVKAL